MIGASLPCRLEELSRKADQLWLGMLGLETLADGSQIEPGHVTPLLVLAQEVSSLVDQTSEILEQVNIEDKPNAVLAGRFNGRHE